MNFSRSTLKIRTSTGFSISKIFLKISYCICDFPSVKAKRCRRNNTYQRLLQYYCITLSNNVLKFLAYTPIRFCERKTYSSAMQIFNFSVALQQIFFKLENYTGVGTMVQQESRVHPMNEQEIRRAMNANKYDFYQTFSRWKMAKITVHQRLIIDVKKNNQRLLFRPIFIHFRQNI